VATSPNGDARRSGRISEKEKEKETSTDNLPELVTHIGEQMLELKTEMQEIKTVLLHLTKVIQKSRSGAD